MTETKQLDFSADSNDEWMQACHRMYTRQKQKEAADAAEGREFCPVEEGLNPHERIKCLQAWGVPERILNNLEVLKEGKEPGNLRQLRYGFMITCHRKEHQPTWLVTGGTVQGLLEPMATLKTSRR